MKKINSPKQINRTYHSHIKTMLKGAHERAIFDSLSAGKNSYMRMDRLASSSFDKSWIEIIEDVIFDLGDIIANPRQNIKTEGSLTPVELAKKVTSESVQHLASHTQYIKEVDEYGNVIPSKLLSMYTDDDIHTYENRFIATFVRRLMLFITKRYEYVTKFAELRNEEILFFKNTSIVDGAEVEIETKVKVSYKNEDEDAMRSSNYVDRIKETRQYILYFYNSPFMKLMKNDRDVRNPIVQTNIIRKNPKYHHCYEVYRFIETYDRLGVNYKIDENYSLLTDDELAELNHTLFANYITLKGNNMSKNHKTVSKTYKPRILTSMDDESFIYGPLLEGPIEFVRIDEGYQAYLESKLKKDLPLHPTKKEKEYYEDEYDARAENKQDNKQLNDLIRRRQKEVTAFEKTVKNILAKREEARLKLLEAEKAALRQEETDLLEAARRAIVEASRQHMAEQSAPQEEKPVAPVVEEAPKEEKVYEPTVSFIEAADEIWPQLKNPTPLKKEPKEEIPVVEEAPVEAAPTEEVQVEEPIEEEKPVEVTPEPVKEEPASENKPEPKVYEPTVTFNEAADEIWPQLNNPKPLPKQEEEPQPIKKEPWVKQPKPKPTPAKPAKKEKPKAEPKKEEKKPEPIPEPKKEEAKPEPKKEKAKPAPKKKEAKPAPKKEAPKPVEKEAKKPEKKPASKKPEKKEEKKPEPVKKEEPQKVEAKPLPKGKSKKKDRKENPKPAPAPKKVVKAKGSRKGFRKR